MEQPVKASKTTFRMVGGAGAACALLGLIIPIAGIAPSHPPVPTTGTEHPPGAFVNPSFLSEITHEFEWSDWGVEHVEFVIAAALVAVALVGFNWAVDRPATRTLVVASGIVILAVTVRMNASSNLFNRADTSVAISDGYGENLLLLGGVALVVTPLAARLVSILGSLLRR